MDTNTRGQLVGGLFIVAGVCLVLGLFCLLGAGVPGRSRAGIAPRVNREAAAVSRQQGGILLGAGFVLGVAALLVGASIRDPEESEGRA